MSKHKHGWLVGRLLLGCLVFTMLLGNDEGFLVFQPEQLTINAGDKVRFEVRGLGPHNLIVAGWLMPLATQLCGNCFEPGCQRSQQPG